KRSTLAAADGCGAAAVHALQRAARFLSGRRVVLRWRGNVGTAYDDVLTSGVVAALNELARLDVDRRALMQARLDRRAVRRQRHERIGFLNPDDLIGRTRLRV